MANNPSMSALTRIHKYYTDHGKDNYKISCLVSLGCGNFVNQHNQLIFVKPHLKKISLYGVL